LRHEIYSMQRNTKRLLVAARKYEMPQLRF
jgi:hypothetical protein